MKWSTHKLVRLALFLAIGVILNIIERAINIPLLPGMRLGLANTIGLIVLFFYGPLEFVLIGFLRVLLASLYGGFGVSFFISLAGWGLSSLVILGLYFFKKLSIFGLSMISAVMHGLGQVIVVAIIYQSIYMFAYFPALVVSGLVSGWLIALISREVLRRIPDREVINHGQ